MVKFSLRQEWQKLSRDLKPMSWRQKVDHIWTYYKEYLVVVLLIVFTVGMLISGVINKSKKVIMGGVLCNVSISQEGYDFLTDGYFASAGGDEKKQAVTLDSLVFEMTADFNEVNENYDTALAGMAMVSGQQVDYFLMDEYAMLYYLNQGMFLELDTFLSPEQLERFSEDLIYLREESEEEKYPYALRITDLPFVKDCVRNEGEVYLAVAGNAPNLEGFRQLWEQILQWKTEN